MTSRPNHDLPPHGAVRLISLLANPEEADLILGDLSEEFFRLASQSGQAFARRWYWRQALKSVPYLIYSEFRASPWLTMTALAGGFLLRRLAGRLPEFATFAFIDRFAIYEHHFQLYRFLASTALDIEHVLTFLLVGCVVAWLAHRREMAPAIALAMIYAAMAMVGSATAVARGGDPAYLWRLSWYFTDSLALITGAVFVKRLRLNVARRLARG